MNTSTFIQRLRSDYDTQLKCVLLVFVVLVRVLTLQYPLSNPDALHYWEAAKHIVLGLPYLELDHQTVRFAIILPMVIVQAISTSPYMWYVLPVLLTLAHFFLLYAIAKRTTGNLGLIITIVAFFLFPYMIFVGSQNMPAGYSIFYLLSGFLCILKAGESPQRENWWYVAAGVFHFLAYLTKITNLFLVPAFLLILFLERRRIKPLLLYGGTLLLLFIVESGAFIVFTEYSHRLDVILSSHLSESYNKWLVGFDSIWGLFGRFSESSYPMGYQIITWPYFVLYLLLRKKIANKYFDYSFYIILSFFFFMTFSVKSIDPIVPVNTFRSRYFKVILPFLFLSYGIFFAWFSTFLKEHTKKQDAVVNSNVHILKVSAVLGSIVLFMLVVFALELPPSKYTAYYKNPLKLNEYPLFVIDDYYRVINKAYAEGLPFVMEGVDDGDEDPIYEIRTIFLADNFFRSDQGIIRTERVADKERLVFSKSDSTIDVGKAETLIFVRRPFRISINDKLLTNGLKTKL